jgi:bacillithiol synthase
MTTTAQFISYNNTGFFSTIVSDYISGNDLLKPFYSHPVSIEGIKAAITARKKYPTNRKELVEILKKQYGTIETSAAVKANIENLVLENTFTITTAHQPNIFTGHLYFIYKILHTARLAEEFKMAMPQNNFVPIYYMGSEDADLDELGHIFINGEKLEWQTKQTGAVGRMKVDKALVKLIDTIAGQVVIHPFGNTIIDVMKDCYKEGVTIERATFKLVNHLFGAHGVIIVLPDNAALKKLFVPIVEKELTETFSHTQVAATVAAFPKEYKVQASGRELNLFYLKDDSRERIVSGNAKFQITNSQLQFSKEEIIEELHQYPERFSANVILRPVFQEMILPNIAFVGGGGEIAYWLELKKVFDAVDVPYPVLVLRNSFIVVEKDYGLKAKKSGFSIGDLFKPEQDLMNTLVKKESSVQLSLEKEQQALNDIYEKLKTISGAVDITLTKHTGSLKTNALQKVDTLQKKMLKAEKKKFEAQQRQLHKLKAALFPNNNLQERIENLIPFYAKWGDDFIKTIYKNSLVLEQQFVILEV